MSDPVNPPSGTKFKRSLHVLGSAACALIVACAAPAATVTPPAPTAAPTASATPAAVPSAKPTDAPATATPTPAVVSAGATPSAAASHAVESLCVGQQGDMGPGDPSIGTLEGSIDNGRILIGIEAAAGPGGTFALAYIDKDGLHEIPIEPDFSLAHATWETADTLLFDSQRAGDRHIFRMNIDDGSVEQVTDGELIGQSNASVLPDGRFVHEMYSCAVPQDLGLQITTADGSSTTELTQPQPIDDPGGETRSWLGDASVSASPDGKRVAFLRVFDENNSAVFTVPSGGGEARRMTPDLDQPDRPRWSPDGTRILYDYMGKLWTVDAEGGNPQVLLREDVGSAFEADWSPDGSQIVFKHYEPGWSYNELHIADADGTNERVLWVGDYSTAETVDWGS